MGLTLDYINIFWYKDLTVSLRSISYEKDLGLLSHQVLHQPLSALFIDTDRR